MACKAFSAVLQSPETMHLGYQRGLPIIRSLLMLAGQLTHIEKAELFLKTADESPLHENLGIF